MKTSYSRERQGNNSATMLRFTFTMIVLLVSTMSLATTALAQLQADVSAAGIVLTWTAPGDDGNTGTASLYDLRYSRQTITAANWSDWTQMNAVQNEPLPAAAGTVQSITLANMPPSTTFYFAIRAGDEAGNWSGLSNVVSVTTPAEFIPPSPIADLKVLTVGAGSVSLGWTAPGDDTTTGTAAQYVIRYATSPITAATWTSATTVSNAPTPGPAGTAQSVTVSGLQGGVTYYFAIMAADEVPNWSGLSNVVSGVPTGGGADTTPPEAILDLIAS